MKEALSQGGDPRDYADGIYVCKFYRGVAPGLRVRSDGGKP
ncbi:MAG: hypothetical protein QM757_38620 [Paludibaculum sp.]